MLNIFLDTEQALYWLENAQRSNPKIECVISRKLPIWLADTVLKKVAIFEVLEFNLWITKNQGEQLISLNNDDADEDNNYI
jgi:hypothetical protein